MIGKHASLIVPLSRTIRARRTTSASFVRLPLSVLGRPASFAGMVCRPEKRWSLRRIPTVFKSLSFLISALIHPNFCTLGVNALKDSAAMLVLAIYFILQIFFSEFGFWSRYRMEDSLMGKFEHIDVSLGCNDRRWCQSIEIEMHARRNVMRGWSGTLWLCFSPSSPAPRLVGLFPYLRP